MHVFALLPMSKPILIWLLMHSDCMHLSFETQETTPKWCMKDTVLLCISDKFFLFVPSPSTRTFGSRRFFQPNFYLIIPQLLQNEIYLLTMSWVLERFQEMFVSDAKGRDKPPNSSTNCRRNYCTNTLYGWTSCLVELYHLPCRMLRFTCCGKRFDGEYKEWCPIAFLLAHELIKTNDNAGLWMFLSTTTETAILVCKQPSGIIC
jgi:hypothetical protein